LVVARRLCGDQPTFKPCRSDGKSRAKSRSDGLSSWALALQQRRGYWKAVVAIASKNARLAWAPLHRGEAFRMPA
jgi:transposase